jgi:class 3 adenylate cyclase
LDLGNSAGLLEGSVARYDAFVAKSMGDGILVYFGFPRPQEDDAERAQLARLNAFPHRKDVAFSEKRADVRFVARPFSQGASRSVVDQFALCALQRRALASESGHFVPQEQPEAQIDVVSKGQN